MGVDKDLFVFLTLNIHCITYKRTLDCLDSEFFIVYTSAL